MTATRRPTASSSGAAAKLRGSVLAGLSGMPGIPVAEHDHLVVADDPGGPIELLAPDLGESVPDSGLVHGRVQDVAFLPSGAGHQDGVDALGVVAGHRPGPFRRLVVGMGVDRQKAQRRHS